VSRFAVMPLAAARRTGKPAAGYAREATAEATCKALNAGRLSADRVKWTTMRGDAAAIVDTAAAGDPVPRRTGADRVRAVAAKGPTATGTDAEANRVAAWRNGKPYNASRKLLVRLTCEHCGDAFYCPSHRVAPKGPGRRFCSQKCSAAGFAAAGTFAGASNPRWLGGVSQDNMRYRRRQAERHPLQEAARRAVHDAIRRGELTRQPCEVCAAEPAEGHHDDYTKALEVRWLCRRHHVDHHAAERAAS
jgi:hypothetical protein